MSVLSLGGPIGLTDPEPLGGTIVPVYPPPSPPVVPPAGVYDVSIAGHAYPIDTDLDFYRRQAFKHTSIPAQRDSLNFDNSSGENVVNTAGLWRRSGQNWNMGSGQKFFDTKGASSDRFYTSKGVNPWVREQLTLLNDTVNGGNTSGSLGYNAGGQINIMTAGSYTYYLEGDSLKFRYATDALQTVTGLPSVSDIVDYSSITHNGSYFFVACKTGGIYYGAIGSTVTKKYVAIDSTYGCFGLVKWAGDRLWAAGGPAITSHDISGATWNAGVATFTTSGAHGYIFGDSIVVQGAIDPSGYEVFVVPVVDVGSPTTFSVPMPVDPGTYVSGGTTRLWLNSYSGPYLFAFQPNHAIGNAPGTNDVVTPFIPSGTAGNKAKAAGLGGITNQWVWSDICQGVSQIYASGYNVVGDFLAGGGVYRTTIDTSATPTLSGYTYPAKALPMAAGEYPTALFGYLNYIFVGTNLGVRMCQTLNVYDPNANSTGDLKSGPVVPGINTPVKLPVTAFTAYRQYVWFSWANYDDSSTGIGRLDLTTFIDDLAPAYASDLMVAGQGVVDLDWDYTQNAPLIAVSGHGVYQQSANLVAQGSITSGWFSYDIPETKTALFARLTAPSLNGTVNFSLAVDYGNPTYIGTFQQSALIGATSSPYKPSNPAPIPAGGAGLGGKQFSVTMTMEPKDNLSPLVNRWQIDAIPQVSSETLIETIISPYPWAVVEGAEAWFDPYMEYAFLDNLRRTQQIVWYVEGRLSAQVLIDSVEWCPIKERADYIKGFNAVLVITMKTINGFTVAPVPL